MHDYYLKLTNFILIITLSLLSCSLRIIMEAVTLGGHNKSGTQVRILSEPLRGSVVQWQYSEISMVETLDNSNLKSLAMNLKFILL